MTVNDGHFVILKRIPTVYSLNSAGCATDKLQSEQLTLPTFIGIDIVVSVGTVVARLILD